MLRSVCLSVSHIRGWNSARKTSRTSATAEAVLRHLGRFRFTWPYDVIFTVCGPCVTWRCRAGVVRTRRLAAGVVWTVAQCRPVSPVRSSRSRSCFRSRSCGSGDCERCPCARRCELASSTADAEDVDSSGWTRRDKTAGRRTTWTPSTSSSRHWTYFV